MVKINIDFQGIKEVQKALEEACSEKEMQKANKEIYQQCADVTHPRMQSHMPRSDDYTKSGKKGYRPEGHARDNIPKRVTKNYAEVGWVLVGGNGEKRDVRNWFYMKFVEWGTTKQPPQDFIYNTREESNSDYSRIAQKEYLQLLKDKIGG